MLEKAPAARGLQSFSEVLPLSLPYLPAGHSKQGTSVLGRNLPRGQLHGVGASTGPELEHVLVFATAAHAVSD